MKEAERSILHAIRRSGETAGLIAMPQTIGTFGRLSAIDRTGKPAGSIVFDGPVGSRERGRIKAAFPPVDTCTSRPCGSSSVNFVFLPHTVRGPMEAGGENLLKETCETTPRVLTGR